MNDIWSWIKGAADRLTGSMDDGSFFSRPWQVVHASIAMLLGAAAVAGAAALFLGGFVACFELYGPGGYHAGVQAAQAGILISMALLITGLFVARIWWCRSTSLAQRTEGGRVFITAPIMAHLVRTCGEVVGVFWAVGAWLFSLAAWPFAAAARQPFMHDWIGRMGMSLRSTDAWSVLPTTILAPAGAFLLILTTRWIAECIEVFFAIANNTRALREAPSPPAAVPRPPFPVNGNLVLAGILCYLLLALPLHQWSVLLPAAALLALAFRKGWTVTATLLVAVVAIVLVRTLFAAAADGDDASIAQVFIDKSAPLHILPFLLVLAAIVMAMLEGSGRSSETLRPGHIWSIGLGLALLHALFPATHAIAEAMARHELTATEQARANELFKAYQERPFGWRAGDHVDTTRTFTVGAPTVRADRYGMITVSHELALPGGTMWTEFACPHKDIRLPARLTYAGANVQAAVQYMDGDSIALQELPNGRRHTAVALDAVRHRHERDAEQRALLFNAYRDSLNGIIDTVQGVFVSHDCVHTTCFAWFDVEHPEGREKRSFYCPASTVSGYPVSALPKDGASWTIVTRETAIGTDEALAQGSGPAVYELIGLRPAIDAAPEKKDPPSLPKPPPAASSRTTAPPREQVYRPAEVDQEPAYQGGRAALRSHLAGRRYPAGEKAAGIIGKVQVSFVVGRDGTVRDVRIDRSPGYVNFDNEAERVVQAMPPWNPGRKNGEPVDVRMTVTVDFSLNE